VRALRPVPTEARKPAANASKPLVVRRRLPRTLKAAVKLGERDLLTALRDKLADKLDGGVPAYALGHLVKELRDLDREIRALDSQEALRAEEARKKAMRGDRAWDQATI
jgi:hypothetical protein